MLAFTPQFNTGAAGALADEVTFRQLKNCPHNCPHHFCEKVVRLESQPMGQQSTTLTVAWGRIKIGEVCLDGIMRHLGAIPVQVKAV